MAKGASSNADRLRTTERRGAGQARNVDGVPSAGDSPPLTDGDIPATIARDSEVSAAYVAKGGTLVNVTALNALTFSAVVTQAEAEALRNEVSSLLATLRVHL